MSQFSTWVEQREKINVCEDLAYALVNLNIDPKVFSECILDFARKGELKESVISEIGAGLLGVGQGLLGGIANAAKSGWNKAAGWYKDAERKAAYKAAFDQVAKVYQNLSSQNLLDKNIQNLFRQIGHYLMNNGQAPQQAQKPARVRPRNPGQMTSGPVKQWYQ